MKLIEAVKKTKSPIVIYGGRFQGGPGLHHYKTYEWLVKKFGRQNVYVVMTDVKGPQSPFSFAERKKIWRKYGVASNRIVKVSSPYKADEVTTTLPKGTPVVWGIGTKDAGRIAGGNYFLPFPKNNDNLVGYDKNGYFIITPHISLKIKGKEKSGTQIRKVLGSTKMSSKNKIETFKKIFGWYDKNIYNLVVSKLGGSL